jgi:cytochrome c oxidase subunit IV
MAADQPPAHAEHGHDQAHAHHPTPRMYVMIGIILTVLTAIEVALYYVPGFEETVLFRPVMLTLSTGKFVLVILFYMHLRYDSKLFKALFYGPLIIAVITLFALMLLFGQLSFR